MNTSNLNVRTAMQQAWTVVAGLTLVSVAMLPVVAQATDFDPPAPQIVVRYADLNASSPAGATVLYRRIHQAAAEVCRTNSPRDAALAARARSCEDQATANAIAAIHSPQLDNVYFAKTGRSGQVTMANGR